MNLKERIQHDGADVFMDAGEFAEEVVYVTPAESKTVNAVVVRYELSPTEENVYRSLKKQAEVYIACDAQRGVVAVSKTDDRVMLKDTEGAEREARINEVISRDEGMWHLLVGW